MLVDRERRADTKSRSVKSRVRNRTYQSVIPHCGSAPDHTRPEAVDRVVNHTPEQNIKYARGRRGARNTRRGEITDHFHVTSEARASCELAS